MHVLLRLWGGQQAYLSYFLHFVREVAWVSNDTLGTGSL